VAVMDAVPPGRSDSGQALSRRRLLWLGGAGLAATVSGCALWDHPTPPSKLSPAASSSSLANVPPAPVAPPPMTSVAPTVSPASAEILCRAAWGAADARPGGRPHTPSRMTIHHTAVYLGDNSNAPARLRQHQRYHQDTQGWIDIAYHLSVDRNGNIYELRDPLLAGDTATSYDTTGHFLVVCEGNFDDEQVTEEQLNGAALAFAWAANKFGIPTDTLEGHRDASTDTACPGASLYDRVSSGDLQSRIDSLLAAGGVHLAPVCGPAAADIVTAIQAGLR
jgi:hypothetical protein